jgi:putative endonuclease
MSVPRAPRGRDPRRDLGRRAEEAAAAHLESRGHVILARNVRLAGGEIDLVTEAAGTVVFVEVRCRTGDRFGTPFESVDRQKRERLVRLAQQFVSKHRLGDRSLRFDVVAVDWRDGRVAIDHLDNAFGVGD